MLLTIVGLTLNRFGINKLIWNIDAVFTCSIFFYIGYIFRKNNYFLYIFDNSKQNCILLVNILINLLCTIISIKNGQGLEIWHSWYGIEPITYLGAFAGIFATIIISYNIHFNELKYIGENSLIYFALHQSIILVIINKMLSILKINYDTCVLYWIISIFKLFVILLVLKIISKIINNTHLKKLIGK